MFKDLVFGKNYFKGGKFDGDYLVSNAVNYQVKNYRVTFLTGPT